MSCKTKPAKAAKRGSAKGAGKSQSATEADSQEEAYFLETLEANKQISRQPGALPPGATHQVERDESGNADLMPLRMAAESKAIRLVASRV